MNETSVPASVRKSHPSLVFAGVDTHKQLQVVAVIVVGETFVATRSLPTTRGGKGSLGNGFSDECHAAVRAALSVRTIDLQFPAFRSPRALRLMPGLLAWTLLGVAPER